MRRVVTVLAVIVALAAAITPRPASAQAVVEPRDLPTCEWLAGDFHVHTWNSHDTWAGPTQLGFPQDPNTAEDEFYTWGWQVSDERDLAQSRGLDYIALSDHANLAAKDDPAWGTGNLIWVPNYENTLGGHSQMLGAGKVYDNGDKTLADVERVARELRADGGAFQINHPADGKWAEAYGPAFVPDVVEIWNIGAWAYEPPAPATNEHESGPRFLDSYLDAGNRVGATGGSDSHWRSTTAAQGIGQPTTWVCAEEPTQQGILEGVRAGRTSISHQPPAQGTVFADIRVGEKTLGSVVEPGTTATATVQGAPGAWLKLVTNGSTELAKVPVTGNDFSYEFTLDEPGWVRAEVFYEDAQGIRNALTPLCDAIGDNFEANGGPEETYEWAYCESKLAVVAMTSPVYFEADDFDPATTLVYDGDVSGRPGTTATFAATLTGSDGPISGAAIAFVYRGETYSGVTDESGRATTQVKLTGPPGTYDLFSGFSGSDVYRPSEDSDVFTVTPKR